MSPVPPAPHRTPPTFTRTQKRGAQSTTGWFWNSEPDNNERVAAEALAREQDIKDRYQRLLEERPSKVPAPCLPGVGVGHREGVR